MCSPNSSSPILPQGKAEHNQYRGFYNLFNVLSKWAVADLYFNFGVKKISQWSNIGIGTHRGSGTFIPGNTQIPRFRLRNMNIHLYMKMALLWAGGGTRDLQKVFSAEIMEWSYTARLGTTGFTCEQGGAGAGGDVQHPHSECGTWWAHQELLWSPRNWQLSVTQCLSGFSTPSTELYSLLANKHNLLPFHALGMAAEINEQEKDGVLNPACWVWRG